jgi:hypothetical protein
VTWAYCSRRTVRPLEFSRHGKAPRHASPTHTWEEGRKQEQHPPAGTTPHNIRWMYVPTALELHQCSNPAKWRNKQELVQGVLGHPPHTQRARSGFSAGHKQTEALVQLRGGHGSNHIATGKHKGLQLTSQTYQTYVEQEHPHIEGISNSPMGRQEQIPTLHVPVLTTVITENGTIAAPST